MTPRVDLGRLAEPGSDEERLLLQIELDRLPAHVAVIMDGNGRWARQRHLPRVAGHRAGITAVRETVETSARLGLEVLSLYAFSRENWKRPRREVDTLMGLLREYLSKELASLQKNDIRLSVIGRMQDLATPIRRELEDAIEATRSNGGMRFNVALSYGGRAEIVDACRAVVESGLSPNRIDESVVGDHLYTAGQPDPDLLIRTSGEMRISNFMLWQIAYSEIWLTSTLWPDFRRRDLYEAILDYQRRERRYGGLAPEGVSEPPAVAPR